MTQFVDEFDFSSHQGAAVAKEANKGGDFQREIDYLNLKADPASQQQGKDMAIIRMVTEHEQKPWMQGFGTTKYNFAWITVPQHFAQTKQKPPYAKEDSNWPAKWNAVCRKGPIFAKKYNNECYICDHLSNKAGDRTWGLAIEREQVIDPVSKQVLGYRDKTREVFVRDDDGNPVIERIEPDGTAEGKKIYAKKVVPAWLVLNYGWKNFFNPLDGQASWNQTVLDRDYVVRRSGSGSNDTSYAFIAIDPIILPEGNEYGLPAGTKYDLGMILGNDENGRPIPLMEALYPDMPDLRKIIAEKTTDDYYGRWFVPGWLPKDFDPSKVHGATQQQGVGGYQPVGGQNAGYQPPQGGVQGYVPPQQTQSQPQQPTQTPAAPEPQQAAAEPSGDMLANLKNRVLSGQGQPAQGSSGQ